MIYNKFNNYIYEHFFNKERFGETILMVVDEFVMNEFFIRFQTSKKELEDEIRQNFNRSWAFILSKNKGIPNILGFIAIQIYEAFLMQNEDKFSSREYNPRLAKCLNVSQNQLQKLYTFYQDNLWHKLELWASQNGFSLPIPETGYGPRRYTQYPLSQALLNQEDLKKIPFLFQNVGLKPDEYLAFEDFEVLIKHSDENIHLTNHYYRVKEKLLQQNREQLLYLQLFGFFNNEWDGSYPDEIEKGAKKKNAIEKNQAHLTITNNLDTLKILNQEYQCLHEFVLLNQHIFKTIKEYYNSFHPDILIFVKDKSYNEWIDRRYLEQEGEHIIICKTNSRTEAFIHDLDSNYTKLPNPYFSIFKVSLSNKISNHFYWKPFFSKKSKNYVCENGLKLSRKVWMLGAGPTIRFFKETDAWINGEKLIFNNNEYTISCRDFGEGTFRLKVKDWSPEKFQIKKPKVISNTDLQGWQVKISQPTWEHSTEKYQISGLSTWFPVCIEKSSIRTWVNALTQKSSKIKNSSIVINAIKQSKYGL